MIGCLERRKEIVVEFFLFGENQAQIFYFLFKGKDMWGCALNVGEEEEMYCG